MTINILAFGIAKDVIGDQSLPMELDHAITVRELKDKLTQQFPQFTTLASLRLAVNGEYVEDQTVINSRDEVVIIPPVSGG